MRPVRIVASIIVAILLITSSPPKQVEAAEVDLRCVVPCAYFAATECMAMYENAVDCGVYYMACVASCRYL